MSPKQAGRSTTTTIRSRTAQASVMFAFYVRGDQHSSVLRNHNLG